MAEINTEITINASIEKVWQVLTDFDSYKVWNPFIRNIRGSFRLNERLIVTINPPGKKEMVFKPKIIHLDDKVTFSWIGNLLIPGIFDGQHNFYLKQLEPNLVRFIHSEHFTGILSKPIFQLIKKSTQLGFEQMNQALKKYCEL